MYKIFYKLCHPIICNHFKFTPTQICTTRNNCDYIKPFLIIII